MNLQLFCNKSYNTYKSGHSQDEEYIENLYFKYMGNPYICESLKWHALDYSMLHETIIFSHQNVVK